LAGVEGAYCGPFDLQTWRRALAPHLAGEDPRIDGRPHAEPLSAERTAERVVAAWRESLA
jgi:hypothetical protein